MNNTTMPIDNKLEKFSKSWQQIQKSWEKYNHMNYPTIDYILGLKLKELGEMGFYQIEQMTEKITDWQNYNRENFTYHLKIAQRVYTVKKNSCSRHPKTPNPWDKYTVGEFLKIAKPNLRDFDLKLLDPKIIEKHKHDKYFDLMEFTASNLECYHEYHNN